VPEELIMVWFAQDVKTSTMFSAPVADLAERKSVKADSASSNSIIIDFTTISSATRLYSKQTWSTPS
jgi:hypothetical protein